MATYSAANATKFDAGGSGDNYIADGYIKSVEKVWIDTYNNVNLLTSADTILIGRVPKNKKITDVVVYMPALYSAGASTGSIYIGSSSSMVITSGSTFLGLMYADGNGGAVASSVYQMGTATTLRLHGSKIGTVTGEDVGIYIKVDSAVADPTQTAGTIRSIIRYT